MAVYLGLDIKTVATISLVIQTLAYFVLLIGFAFAKKKNFQRHKRTMSVATLLNFVSLFVVMLPSLYSIISGISLATVSLNSLIIILHHSLGLITLIMASLAILRPCGSIVKNVKILMVTIFTLWSITYFLGVGVYLMLYLPIVFH
jgi:uncharacterized membrane protein YozB (DUF420 family)